MYTVWICAWKKGLHGPDACASSFKVKHAFISCLVVLFLCVFEGYRMACHYINTSQSHTLKKIHFLKERWDSVTGEFCLFLLLHQSAQLFRFCDYCFLGVLCFKNVGRNGSQNLTVLLPPAAMGWSFLNSSGARTQSLSHHFHYCLV